ncbi:MAG: hypothetical protein ABIJ91_00515 [Candidatus Kuenenbacteria bacterium]
MDLEQKIINTQEEELQKTTNSLLVYRVYGKILMTLGTVVAIVGSVFGFPFVAQWGLVYIFGSRIPQHGWLGPNNTAVMMLTDILWFVLGVILFSILMGYVFNKISKSSKLTTIALTFSIIAHIIIILVSIIVLVSCADSCDGLGEAIIFGLGLIVYLGLSVVSWILLIVNRRLNIKK